MPSSIRERGVVGGGAGDRRASFTRVIVFVFLTFLAPLALIVWRGAPELHRNRRSA